MTDIGPNLTTVLEMLAAVLALLIVTWGATR